MFLFQYSNMARYNHKTLCTFVNTQYTSDLKYYIVTHLPHQDGHSPTKCHMIR